jgi:hypothetical protein
MVVGLFTPAAVNPPTSAMDANIEMSSESMFCDPFING